MRVHEGTGLRTLCERVAALVRPVRGFLIFFSGAGRVAHHSGRSSGMGLADGSLADFAYLDMIALVSRVSPQRRSPHESTFARDALMSTLSHRFHRPNLVGVAAVGQPARRTSVASAVVIHPNMRGFRSPFFSVGLFFCPKVNLIHTLKIVNADRSKGPCH